MTDTIVVRARNEEHAAVLVHPQGPPLTDEGVTWPYDGLTCRLLTEGDLVRVEPEADGELNEEAETTTMALPGSEPRSE